MGGKTHTDCHVRASVFENQIPADNPGNQFSQRGVGVGISRTRDGNHGRQFGVTEAGQRADHGHQNQRDGDGWTGAGPPCHCGVVNDEVRQRRIHHAGGVEFFSGDGRANDREDARADHRTYAQRCQRPRPKGLPQRVLGFFRVPDQLIDRLAGAKLAEQGSSPRPAIGGNCRRRDLSILGLPGSECLRPITTGRRQGRKTVGKRKIYNGSRPDSASRAGQEPCCSCGTSS